MFEDGEIDDHLRLARRMCEVSGRPLSLITLQRAGQGTRRVPRHPGRDRGRAGRRAGDVGPGGATPVGLLISLESRLNPLAAAPSWAECLADPSGLQATLARPAVRARILADVGTAPGILDRFPRVFELGDPPDYDLRPERELRARANAAGTGFLELVYDLLAGGGTLYVPAANFVDGDLGAVREMLVHPLTIPGLSDAGAHCTTIGDFDFATFTLGYWAHDAAPGDRIPIEAVIRQQCLDSAALFGLHDRGVLLPGYRADVNLIDLATVGSGTPVRRADLPGGAARLVGRGVGYEATLVAGEVVLERGQHTGRTPGRVARPAPAPSAP